MEHFVLNKAEQAAIDIFVKHQGIMRTGQIFNLGVYQKTLYSLKKQGIIVPLTRGIFHLVDYDLPNRVDLISVSLLHPETIFCLVTALDLHDITTVIPRSIHIALPQGSKPPKIEGHRIKAFYFTKEQLEVGVQNLELSGFTIKVFSPEKSVIDCFKYANKIGLNVAIEALKLCITTRKSKARDFFKFARIAHVHKRIQPYLEAIYE